jgi:Leucine rich repeat
MEALRVLYFDNNSLSGPIPSEMTLLRDLDQIYLGSNKFEGSIPTSISLLSKLKTIDLSNNTFSGLLPTEMGLLKSLTVLKLQSNPELSGTLPESFAQLTALKELLLKNTNITGGLNEAFCTKDILITEIQSDCAAGDEGNITETVPCDCCTSCCEPGGSACDINVHAMCETKKGVFEAGFSRGAECSCSEDGTNVTCSDTACESCDLDETSCAVNLNYGYTLNETTGEIVSFQNTIQYTTGTWAGTELFYQSLENGPNCNLWVNGEKCRECSNIICSSGFAGFRITCNNVDGAGIFNR